MNDTPDLYDPPDPDSPATLRLAGDLDCKALERLAHRDGRDQVGESPRVVAEEDSSDGRRRAFRRDPARELRA